MRVMTFSRFFPAHHPKKGQPTRFPEKLWTFLAEIDANTNLFEFFAMQEKIGASLPFNQFGTKYHTIRAGQRWKVGDWFIPKVWGDDVNPKSGRKGPYHSKQIVIGPPIEVKKVWDFDIEVTTMKNINPGDRYVFVKIDGRPIYCNAETSPDKHLQNIALNDGLSVEDFKAWFKWGKPFRGQIICWNDQIEY